MLAFAHPIAARTTMREVLAQNLSLPRRPFTPTPSGVPPAHHHEPRRCSPSSCTSVSTTPTDPKRHDTLHYAGCGSYPTPSQHDLPHFAVVANTRPIVAGRVKVFYHLCGGRNVSRLALSPTLLPVFMCQSTADSLILQTLRLLLISA